MGKQGVFTRALGEAFTWKAARAKEIEHRWWLPRAQIVPASPQIDKSITTGYNETTNVSQASYRRRYR
jgi:hypothetical protein